MRHLDVAIYGMATALLIVVIMVAPFGVRPKCFKDASSPIFCTATRATTPASNYMAYDTETASPLAGPAHSSKDALQENTR